ncbi:DUF397 domain-containing protein [Streptomyces sp. NPDC018584]|uniref:DUF397 domain-containing protein n=1 Tax=unclassified Streptomyces TaxID=2593676 RepID=UPI0037B45280
MNELADLYTVDLTGAVWQKSSYTANNGNCVEVASPTNVDGIFVRDSKNTHLAAIRARKSQWAPFVTAVVTDSLEPR